MRNLFVIIFLVLGPGKVWSNCFFQEQRHYVVIGAFAILQNAERFVDHASRYLLDARYEINPDRNLYYVYVMVTHSRKEAISKAMELRLSTPYHDTWVYNGLLGKPEEGKQSAGEDINPVDAQVQIQINIRDQPDNGLRAVKTDKSETASGNRKADDKSAVVLETERKEVISFPVIFHMYRADNRQPVDGDVRIIDPERVRKIGTYQGNRVVKLVHPENKEGRILLLAEVFGYRKIQHELNFNHLSETLEQDPDGNFILPFEMVRLQKGDIAVMYNVYFFKDAAVMRPESRWEVNSLLDMLRENPNYKIRIHGHTNGNAPGRIISVDLKKGDFFSLNHTIEGFGSAKKLSRERAETIKAFLVGQGIDPSRLVIKAWGGRRPLVDKMHLLAESNVRVEIEILEN
jgi:outer membrane protein OmpA-like peptidoglycan-associated protein